MDLTELQTQYYRLEHITRGANQALDDCGTGNILRELTKRADRKELDQAKRELEQVKTENAHLNAQVSSMAQELSRKNEEIRKYHAEQAVVFQRIRELIGQPAKAVTKARLYDHIIESGDPIDTQKTIPILVKYSRLMNGLFEDVQKLLLPAELPDRYSTRLHPDPHPEPCTRQLERWLSCTIRRQPWSRNGFQTRKHRENARESPFVVA